MKKVPKCNFPLFHKRIGPIFEWYQQPIGPNIGWCWQIQKM